MRLLQARPRARRLTLALALLGVLPGAMLHPSAAHAAIKTPLVVTSTGDSATCGASSPPFYTLRCAINQANTDGGNDNIGFDIPSTDSGCSPVTINGASKTVCKISPAIDLPALTANNVTIDGYSQPGASQNTNLLHSSSGDNAFLTIQIDGSTDTDPNGTVGLSIEGSHDTITGLSITGFNNGGLYLTTPGGASSGNTVAGDFIGVAPDGSNAYNGSDDVLVYGGSANNTIGGTGAGDRNVIESGNGNGSGTIGGVNIETDGNVIEGNYLGTAPNGTHVLGGAGLTVAFLSSGGGSNTLGGAGEAGNVINGAGGAVYAGGSKAIIEGNYIGTDAVGDAAITPEPGSTANFGSGIDVASGAAPNYVISNNLISGNLGYGIAVASPSSTVTGNKIGTNAAGTTAIPNDAGGIDVGASNGTIGGTGSGDGNLIDGGATSSILADGIRVESQATNTTIEGNKIGVGLNGEKLGNGGNGIFFASNGTTNPYTQTVSNNTIAYNGIQGSGGSLGSGTGVLVGSNGYTSNIHVHITQNSIFENSDHGIILDGQSPDSCDSSSPSGQPLCPVIDSATTAVVSGHAPGCGAGDCTIEVFVADTLPSDNNHGEGKTYLGSTTTTDSSGDWSFTPANGALAQGQGQSVTATTTKTSGGASTTSAFSANEPVNDARTTTTTTLKSSENPSTQGDSVTFTAQVSGGTPSGTVQFSVDGTVVDTVSLATDGTATYTTSGLSVGTHTIVAVYSGDNSFKGSSSDSLTQTVNAQGTGGGGGGGGGMPPLGDARTGLR